MTLRRAVKTLSGQDVFQCQGCLDCDVDIRDEMDIPLSSIVQLILADDEEVLYCRTVWSDAVLEVSHSACRRGLDLHAVMLALRQEAERKQARRPN